MGEEVVAVSAMTASNAFPGRKLPISPSIPRACAPPKVASESASFQLSGASALLAMVRILDAVMACRAASRIEEEYLPNHTDCGVRAG